jgi:ferric iron reductase protein FhuF
MSGLLSPQEWNALSERFSLSRHNSSVPCHQRIRAADLLDQEKCAEYLDWLGSFIGSPSRLVTASTLVKRYAFLTASPVLYAMAMYNKAIALRLEHCILESPADPADNPSGTKLPRLSLTEMPLAEAVPGHRGIWREKLVRELFAGHLTPLLHTLAEVSRIPVIILWENIAVRIVPLLEAALEEAADPDTACCIREDLQYIIREGPGELFGERRNPFIKLVESPGLLNPDGAAVKQQRRTCCLYYEISGEYCRRCPHE